MANIAALLKSEISRLSRKTIKEILGPIQASVSSHRRQISELKHQVHQLEREIAVLRKHSAGNVAKLEQAETKARFSAKGLKSLRARLDLSAEDFGSLAGVSGQSIYAWESGRTVPRQAQVEALAGLRGIGKKEARAKIEAGSA